MMHSIEKMMFNFDFLYMYVAIGSYHNRNDKNVQQSLVRTFWPQVFNETDGLWNQQPDNIRYVALNVRKFLLTC